MRKQKAINIAIGCVMGSKLKPSEKFEITDILIGLDVGEESEEEESEEEE